MTEPNAKPASEPAGGTGQEPLDKARELAADAVEQAKFLGSKFSGWLKHKK